MKYQIQKAPVRIPVPGNKLIEEFIGLASTGNEDVSVAHMIAPAGWDEPVQVPKFDEITIVLRGKMRILVDENESIELHAGNSITISKNVPVQYSNPYQEECEYWAICLPAFSVDYAGRQ
jgi:ethanolamine utilization protein EutQ